MAPMTQDVAAILSAANKNGNHDGTRSFQNTWAGDADRTRISSSALGSTDSRPRTMLTSVGKNEINAAIMIFGAYPLPNSSTRIGAMAMIGTVRIATAM